MTDSLKITLNLSKLSPRVRMDIPAKLCTVTTLAGEIARRYCLPSKQVSPMSKAKTKWKVECEVTTDSQNVPVAIHADLNIPSAMVGQNFEHGTSVFAAGRAALELLRIYMAQQGLPGEELDLLTITDVILRSVTITYLIPCNTDAEADALVRDINATARILIPNAESWESSNLTAILPARTHTTVVYNKTSLKYCRWEEGAPVNAIIEGGRKLVRIEVRLGERFLAKHKLDQLEQWRDAYATGLYRDLYDMTVAKQLRLKDKLRHKAPREEVFARLTQQQQDILKFYLAGNNPRAFGSVLAAGGQVAQQQAYSKLYRTILKVANIDLNIPWADHVQLCCFELGPRLQYPGDYIPPEGRSAWCFCKDNWPTLLAKMKALYAQALKKFNSTGNDVGDGVAST